MKLQVIVHEEDNGYWAEVPYIPGCATQSETFAELLKTSMKQMKTAYLLL